MGEGHKRRSIDEIIEHMTADFQSSDGQYFHLGFSPPPNSVSSHAWTEAFVSAPISTSQIHYQPNHVHPVFSHDGRIQFKAHHQNILPTIQHNVDIAPSFFQVQPSTQDNSESMTCDNHGGGVPYVAPGQPPRPLGGFVPYHRDYNLFDEGQVRLIRVADQSSKANQWGSTSKPVSGITTNEHTSPLDDGHASLDSSPIKTELMNSFAGQWVPTPTSPYSHFGNQAGTTNNMDVDLPQEVLLKCDKSRGNGILPAEKHKRRSNMDGKSVRPSYSDVLSKSPPNKTHSSPSLVNNKCTAAGSSSEGKGKSANGAVLRNKNGGGRKGLKRQYSSASDEQVVSTANIKSNMTQDAVVGLSNKYGVHGVASKPCGEAISRRWVSLDDLDCGDEEASHCEQTDSTSKEPRSLKVDHLNDMEIKFSLAGNVSSDYDKVKKGARGLNKAKSGNGIQGFNDDASESLSSPNASSSGLTTLNNYKASGGGNSGGKNQGTAGAKRPLHINNNLGTSPWAAVSQCGGEKNVARGTSSVSNVANAGAASSKNCKACSEERKATSASSSGSGTTKSLGSEGGKNVGGGGGGTSSRSRGGGCCSGGGGGQGAPQPPPPPERSSREPQVGKRGQRNRRREGQAPLVTLCRTARLHVIQWGSIILQALLWFLHLLSDILSLSSHLMWNMGSNLWEWLSATSRKVGSAFHDLVSSWLGTGTKGSASKKKSNGVGSHNYNGWLTSWFDWTWRSCTRYCRKIYWRLRSWLSRRGLWWMGSSGYGGDQEWDSDDGDDKDRGPFGRREKGSGRKDGQSESGFHHPESLECNMSLPSTGEEAMKRLLACKGKDPYSILGVTPNCSDDDVKKYYKRQAFLVHPDKNSQPGAEEAFKILVHAFDLIGEPEKRQAYDRRVVETRQAEHAWSEFSDLLSQLQEKIAEAANTIRCTNCGKRHRRVSVQRPCYAARLCSQCKIHHAAREGDIWAESSMFGFLWHYYACMEGGIYDITEWAACQGENLRHLRPNSHNVQYRILLGKRGGNSGGGPSGSPSSPAGHSSGTNTKSSRSSESPSDPDLDHFLNNLYSGGSGVGGGADNSQRQEQSRKRKGKRKK